MSDVDPRPQIKEVAKSVGKVRQEVIKVKSAITKLTEAVQSGFEMLHDAIHENIRAQAELKLMEHLMDVRSVKPQIEAEYDQIQTEREELDERLEKIGERYERKHSELDEKAAERVRNLGSHIFAIEEDQFEEGIEQPFTEQVTTTWQTLQMHNDNVGEQRSQVIRETTGATVQCIRDFLDRQEELVRQVNDHKIEADTLSGISETTPIQLPYYVVEYEVEGTTHRTVVTPSEITQTDSDGWCSVGLSEFEGTESLLGTSSGVDAGTSETIQIDHVVEHLRQYSDSTRFGQSYAETVTETVEEAIPVRVEAGGK